MSWLQRVGEPLCQTHEQADAYITTELRRALPEGWILTRLSGPALSWSIAKREVRPGEWMNQEYDLRVSDRLDLVIFTHGNNDRGPLSLQHVLQKAMVIDAAALKEFGMTACIEYVMAHCKPNEWGYT